MTRQSIFVLIALLIIPTCARATIEEVIVYGTKIVVKPAGQFFKTATYNDGSGMFTQWALNGNIVAQAPPDEEDGAMDMDISCGDFLSLAFAQVIFKALPQP